MARLFDDADKQYLENSTTPPVTAYPYTVSTWVRPDTLAIDMAFFWMGEQGVTNNHWAMRVEGGNAGDPLLIRARNTTAQDAITGNGFNSDEWNHCFGIFTSATDRVCILNGDITNKGTSTVSSTPDTIDRLSVGRMGDSSPKNEFSGDIGEFVLWNVALPEVVSEYLFNRASVSRIRPDARKVYIPIFGTASPEPDYSGSGYNLSLFGDVGTPVVSDHPPLALPFGFDLGWEGQFAEPAQDMPWDRNLQGIHREVVVRAY